jgi:hypothetical protein
MTREFVMLPEFEKQWKHLGLTDDDLNRLQSELLVDPQTGDVMQGTGGVRKMRFALENRGKSGSVRIIYVDFVIYEKLYLITAYPKNEKDNLSKAERNAIKQMVEYLEKTLENGKGAK